MGRKMRGMNLAFTDTQTTGLDALQHEIIEIYLAITDLKGSILSERQWNMHPRWLDRAEAKALEVNGYTRESWDAKGVVLHDQAMREYADLTENCILIGYNAWYDWTMIEAELKRQSVEWKGDYHVIDVASMIFPKFATNESAESISLSSMCSSLGISNEGAHTGKADVHRTLELYKVAIRAN